MHYRDIGFIELNDHYIKGVEYTELYDKKISTKIKIIVFKAIIYSKDILTKLKLLNNSLNINILFKEKPDNNLLKEMKLHKWNHKELPLNPYL